MVDPAQAPAEVLRRYFDESAADQMAAAIKNERAAVRMDAEGCPELARLYRHTAAQHRAAAAEIERMARQNRII